MNPLRQMVDRHRPLRHPDRLGDRRSQPQRQQPAYPVTAGQAETANDLGKAELVYWE